MNKLSNTLAQLVPATLVQKYAAERRTSQLGAIVSHDGRYVGLLGTNAAGLMSNAVIAFTQEEVIQFAMNAAKRKAAIKFEAVPYRYDNTKFEIVLLAF